jgi:hypothetical protein
MTAMFTRSLGLEVLTRAFLTGCVVGLVVALAAFLPAAGLLSAAKTDPADIAAAKPMDELRKYRREGSDM